MKRITFTQPFDMTGAKVFLRGGESFAAIQSASAGPMGRISAANTAFDITGLGVISNPLVLDGTGNRFTVHAGGTVSFGGLFCPDAEAFVFEPGNTQFSVFGASEVNDPAGTFQWPSAMNLSAGLKLYTHGFTAGNATLNFSGNGSLDVDVNGNSWQLPGALNKTENGICRITGDRLTMPAGAVTTVSAGTLELPAVQFDNSQALVTSGVLSLGDGTVLNGAQSISGNGALRLRGSSTVTQNTSVKTKTFIWDSLTDGDGGHTHTISDNAVFTVECDNFNEGTEIRDHIVLGGNAGLVMNVPLNWRTRGTVTVNGQSAAESNIGGTAQFMLMEGAAFNVSGRATVQTPFITGFSSVTTVTAGGRLTLQKPVTWHGGSVSGAGTLVLPVSNTVSAFTFLDVAGLTGLETSQWDIGFGAGVTIAPAGAAAGGPVQTMRGNIWSSGLLSLNAGGPKLVREGTTLLTQGAVWSGQPVDLGNDAGSQDTTVTAQFGGTAVFNAPVTIKSDAKITVELDSILGFNGAVNLDTVNGGNNAIFTGAGRLEFSGPVNVNEAVTVNMESGAVSLDGTTATGGMVHVNAPMVINAATFNSYGSLNTDEGIDTLDVDHVTAGRAGSFAVNITRPSALTPPGKWTINPPGVMNLRNGSTAAVLLSGDAVEMNGTLNVTGNVRSTARLIIGAAGTVNILTPGGALHVEGAELPNKGNELAGGTINGPGTLKGDPGILSGFGTVNAPVDFDFSTRLEAANGTLTMNGPILHAGIFGTANDGAVLNIPPAWNTAGVLAIFLNGGELKGGTMTVSNTTGAGGRGKISCPVINNTRLWSGGGNSGPLLVETALHDSDWDGTANNGTLSAESGNLEIRDNAPVTFGGTVEAKTGWTFFASGFAMQFMPSSKIKLTGGTFRSSHGLSVGGSVEVAAGQDSVMNVAPEGSLVFASGSSTTLAGSLHLATEHGAIEAGAVFSGGGSLTVPEAGVLSPADGSVVNVILDSRGRMQPGAGEAAQVQLKEYRQSSTGTLAVSLAGSATGQYDKLTVSGAAQIGGRLVIEKTSGFQAAPGATFDILTAVGGVTGTFSSVEQNIEGSALEVSYLPGAVRLTVKAESYDSWIDSFPSLTRPESREKSADPDFDGLTNLEEFALNGNPANGISSGRLRGSVSSVSGNSAFTLTIPLRAGAVPDPTDPPGGALVLRQTTDALRYSVQASGDLVGWTLGVSEVTGPDAAAAQAGLPALDPGWEYRTFYVPPGGVRLWMRAVITE